MFLGLMMQLGPKTLKFSEVFSDNLALSAAMISFVWVDFTTAPGEISGCFSPHRLFQMLANLRLMAKKLKVLFTRTPMASLGA